MPDVAGSYGIEVVVKLFGKDPLELGPATAQVGATLVVNDPSWLA